MNAEEKNFMSRFKKNFGRMVKKGVGHKESDNDEENDNDGDRSQVGGKRNTETLDELKGRMTRLEQMFASILDRVDKIGTDVRHIKDNQESSHSMIAESMNSER